VPQPAKQPPASPSKLIFKGTATPNRVLQPLASLTAHNCLSAVCRAVLGGVTKEIEPQTPGKSKRVEFSLYAGDVKKGGIVFESDFALLPKLVVSLFQNFHL